MRTQNGDNPNIKIVDSYKINLLTRKIEVINTILEYTKENPAGTDPEWHRTTASMLIEWDLHNVGYHAGNLSKREGWVISGKDADFDSNAVIRGNLRLFK